MNWWQDPVKHGVEVKPDEPEEHVLKAWPTPQDYNEAVQSGGNFSDPDLSAAEVEINALGLPRVITGAFASVYKFRCGKRDFAVRCFLRNFADQEQRYARISDFVTHDTLPYTVGFEYLNDGLLVSGHRYPILKMEWVDGLTMNEFIAEQHQNSQSIDQLMMRFCEMVDALRGDGIAHGDLQHANIMVLPSGELRLVDYDGMFVPSLGGMQSHELGHPNYQHPSRDANSFGPTLDNFSAWLIYTSLLAIREDHRLWTKLQGGDDCLLFRRSDLEKPESSRAFALLERHSNRQLREHSRFLRSLLHLDISSIPPLEPGRSLKAGRLPPISLSRKRPALVFKASQMVHVFTWLFLVFGTILLLWATVAFVSSTSKFDSNYGAAQRALKAKNYSDAVKFATMALEAGGGTNAEKCEAYELRGTAHKELGEQEARLQDMRAAVQANPHDPMATFELGAAHAALKQPEEALAAMNKYIADHPRDPYGYLNRGAVEIDLKQYQACIDDSCKAMEMGKKPYKSALYNLGLAYSHQGKYAEAIPKLKQALEMDNKDTDAWCELGYCYGKSENWAEAKKAYLACLDVDRNNEDAWSNLSWYAVNVEDYNDAVTYAQRALSYDQKDTNARYHLAFAYSKLGRWDRALTQLDQVIRLAPEDELAVQLRAEAIKHVRAKAPKKAESKRSH